MIAHYRRKPKTPPREPQLAHRQTAYPNKLLLGGIPDALVTNGGGHKGNLREYLAKSIAHQGLGAGQCRRESCKLCRARQKMREEETIQTLQVVRASSKWEVATYGSVIEELRLDIPVYISCNLRCGFHARNCPWTVHDPSSTPCLKVISISCSKKLVLRV